MSANGWYTIIGIGIVVVAAFAYILIQNHRLKRSQQQALDDHRKQISDYLKDKQKNEDEADKEKTKIPIVEDYGKESAQSFIDRTKEPWPR